MQDEKGCSWDTLEESFKIIHVEQEKKNHDFILGTSEKLLVTFSKMGGGRGLPFFLSEDAAAGPKS